MKGIFVDDNMSNLTSASNEAAASLSSNRNNEIGTMYPPPHHHHSFASVPITTNQLNKKKRNLPGNPDPEAEVIALSPKSLMATNRFMCEICNKGFQRDQNLQLHRRGHNLPWKLKQKSKLEVVRKKVYVCPEPSCVHHDPSRALGDLTGIKKHFSRKHGEKKWKCEKCSKRYAVQSDWKAHSKICGTREYRCDCGTLFSRRDSFITHRAFCDALAEETGRSTSSTSLNHHLPLHLPIDFPLKTEPQHLLQQPQLTFNIGSNNTTHNHQLPSWQQQNPNPNINIHLQQLPSAPPHMSATALLQKAAQMGASMSNNINDAPAELVHHPPASSTASIILNGSLQHDHMCPPHHHPSGLSSATDHNHHVMLDHHQLLHSSSTSHVAGLTNIHEILNNMINSKNKLDDNGYQQQQVFSQPQTILLNARNDGHANDELTRDFLGLRADQHFLNMAGLDHMSQLNPNQNQNQNQNRIPWQG